MKKILKRFGSNITPIVLLVRGRLRQHNLFNHKEHKEHIETIGDYTFFPGAYAPRLAYVCDAPDGGELIRATAVRGRTPRSQNRSRWSLALRRVGVSADRRRHRLPMECRLGDNLSSARIAAVLCRTEPRSGSN